MALALHNILNSVDTDCAWWMPASSKPAQPAHVTCSTTLKHQPPRAANSTVPLLLKDCTCFRHPPSSSEAPLNALHPPTTPAAPPGPAHRSAARASPRTRQRPVKTRSDENPGCSRRGPSLSVALAIGTGGFGTALVDLRDTRSARRS
ncbi:uncharacterized protein M421DRAFT_189906 [Didymella exigua CBS 183.55]|uniref:Uncharacterized protein n=1 Tax=Didymella exigua CBS 183.55 TaxID=1150837 RepID=A0A6A5RHM7_9PLEO|nr:uncharacterized protein M421DRAFT_189906 [Didymella exigua CBS 183.55]KAF1927059.1 hypothetical protein M421DRAFT_189906 [Didymella exigua CBS 183.55]